MTANGSSKDIFLTRAVTGDVLLLLPRRASREVCRGVMAALTSHGCVEEIAAVTASASRLVCVKMMDLPMPPYTVSTSFRTLCRDSGDTWTASSLQGRTTHF